MSFLDGAGSAVLRKVLEHEIGHLAGFSHSSSSPVMSSNYNIRSDPSQLSDADLITLKDAYGMTCTCGSSYYNFM